MIMETKLRRLFRFRLFSAVCGVLIAGSFCVVQVVADEPAASSPGYATESSHKTINNILYRPDDDKLTASMREKCRLDIRYPSETAGYPTIVWFHGGGLTGGARSFPKTLDRQGLAVVTVSYRLHPDVTAPAYIEDAAAAVAWVHHHVADYGGSPDRIVVSGHSAGGYLAAMVGLDKQWLAVHKMDANRLAGIAPLSGQMITHFTIRKERGIADTRPVVDEYAPLNHIRKDAPPILLITGDRELELLGRYEENAYAWRMLTVAGHPDCTLQELSGQNHGQMVQPALPVLLQFTERVTNLDRITKPQTP